MPAQIIEEKVFEYAVIQGPGGRIVHNSMQQDAPAVRRRYDDGTYDVINQKTGQVILPPFTPADDIVPTCQHCGERPW